MNTKQKKALYESIMKNVAKTVKRNLDEASLNGVERPQNYTFELVSKFNRFGYVITEYDNNSFITDDDDYEYYYIVKRQNNIICVIDDIVLDDITDRTEFIEIIDNHTI